LYSSPSLQSHSLFLAPNVILPPSSAAPPASTLPPRPPCSASSSPPATEQAISPTTWARPLGSRPCRTRPSSPGSLSSAIPSRVSSGTTVVVVVVLCTACHSRWVRCFLATNGAWLLFIPLSPRPLCSRPCLFLDSWLFIGRCLCLVFLHSPSF